ncbi:MAG: TatD family hydrolase, partial [Candidatus Hadarchaeum sp.]
FARILELAENYDKPVIIHSRWAWREAFEMVKSTGAMRAVFHWYSGPLDVLREIIEQGFYISATPAAEFSKAHQMVIKEVPLERLLLETDSPVKYRGIVSTPSHILKTLKAVAQLKEIDESRLAEITTKNATNIFRIKI